MQKGILLLCLLLMPALAAAQTEEKEIAAPAGSPFNQTKFVPDIALILDFSYVHRNLSDEQYRTSKLPEATNTLDEDKTHGKDNADLNSHRGFNLNYAELTFSSVVDPYFNLFANCELTETGFALEEAYFTTRRLPAGFQLKAGKFLSGFGRINEQHTHYWDFADRPLNYLSFFGISGLNEKGAQLLWLAPMDTYLQFGLEVLQGENGSSFGSHGYNDVDKTVTVKTAGEPNAYVGFIRNSFDIGNLTVLISASGAGGKCRVNSGLDTRGEEGYALHGSTLVGGGSLLLKYQWDSTRSISLQTEYLYREMDAARYQKDSADQVAKYDLTRKQSGLYAQLVLKPLKRWRAGVRYDLMDRNRIQTDDPSAIAPPEGLCRYTGMLEFNPTEFSRLRAQYNYDRSKYTEDGPGYHLRPNHEVILQFNLAIGAHGAHAF